MGFFKKVGYAIFKLLLKTFYKKKYYEQSPSNKPKLFIKKGQGRKGLNDGMRKMQLKIDNNEELKKIQEEIARSLKIETISAKNLKVERLEDIKEWNL